MKGFLLKFFLLSSGVHFFHSSTNLQKDQTPQKMSVSRSWMTSIFSVLKGQVFWNDTYSWNWILSETHWC